MRIAIFDCPAIIINNLSQIICPLILSTGYPLNVHVNVIIFGGLKYVERQDMQVPLHTTGVNNRRNCLVVCKPLKSQPERRCAKLFRAILTQ